MTLASRELVRPVSAIAWDLRSCWARGRRVSLSIAGDVERVEGHVRRVSATGALAVVDGLHVPLGAVLAVHRPSRLGDSTYRDDQGAWSGRPLPREDPRQLRLWEDYDPGGMTDG